jgi:hypothetical protein
MSPNHKNFIFLVLILLTSRLFVKADEIDDIDDSEADVDDNDDRRLLTTMHCKYNLTKVADGIIQGDEQNVMIDHGPKMHLRFLPDGFKAKSKCHPYTGHKRFYQARFATEVSQTRSVHIGGCYAKTSSDKIGYTGYFLVFDCNGNNVACYDGESVSDVSIKLQPDKEYLIVMAAQTKPKPWYWLSYGKDAEIC